MSDLDFRLEQKGIKPRPVSWENIDPKTTNKPLFKAISKKK